MSRTIDVAGVMEKAVLAAGVFHQLDQAHTDRIVKAVYEAGFANRVRLAKMAVEETGMGRWQDKVTKNVVATHYVYEDIKDLKTVGVISHDHLTGITELAQPLAAAAARRDDLRAAPDHRALQHAALAGGDQRGDRRGFGAKTLRVGGVLDIAAAVDAAFLVAHRGADMELRVRRIGADHHGACQMQ